MFLSTLGLNEGQMRAMLQEKRPKKGTSVKKQSRCATRSHIRAKQFVERLLEKLPKMPSHFARAQSDKLYLQEDFTSIRDVYSFVSRRAKAKGIKMMVWSAFLEIFHQKKLSVHPLKKDCCDDCEMYRLGYMSEEDFFKHRQQVTEARLEKENDKKAASANVLHLIADVQKILLLPLIKNNNQYYKTKLQMRNYTIYNLHNKKVRCKIWVETEAGCSANVFASMLSSFIEECLQENPKITEIIIWTDNCCHQNKNVLLSNVLLYLAMKYNIVITQKYFVIGHSQNEADSAHSCIERCVKKRRIYTPKMYVEAITQARKFGPDRDCNEGYEVDLLDYTVFKDFCGVKYYSQIRPGHGAGDPTVGDIIALRYTPNGKMYFKMEGFTSPWSEMPHQLPNPTCFIKERLYESRIPIKASKYKDLQFLKKFIPKKHHHFYDTLPYQ
ncbi:hypothetical protein B566_EDAN002892 [Ephemera danica]|nr:hypothetical protein B566_EDAN002892 [Ephemera danica]